MKTTLMRKDDMLTKISKELIGNGGNSRLMIMLDKVNNEVWSDEFYDHEQYSWKEYNDDNIICVGKVRNYEIQGEGENGIGWNIEIFAPDGDPDESNNDLSGDEWNDYIDGDKILEAINEMYADTKTN